MLFRLVTLLLFLFCLWMGYAEIVRPWWGIAHGSPQLVIHPAWVVLTPMALLLFGAPTFVRGDLEDAVERWYGPHQARSGALLIAGLVVGGCALAGMHHSADSAGLISREDAEWSSLDHVAGTQVGPGGIVFTTPDGHRHPLAWSDIRYVRVKAATAADGSVDAWWVFQDTDNVLRTAQAPDAGAARQVAEGLAAHVGRIRADPIAEARAAAQAAAIQPNHVEREVWPDNSLPP